MDKLHWIFRLIGATVILGVATYVYSTISDSSAWDLVDEGLASNFLLAVPLLAMFGIFIVVLYKVTHRGGQ